MNKLSYVPKPGIEGFPYDNTKARIIHKGAVPSVVERVGNSAKVIGRSDEEHLRRIKRALN